MLNRSRFPAWLGFALLILSLGCAVPVHAGSSVVAPPDGPQSPGFQLAPVVQSGLIAYRAVMRRYPSRPIHAIHCAA